jgi:hypothetical protein
MNMVLVGFHGKKRDAVTLAALSDQSFGFCLYFAGQDSAPVLWNPYKVIGDVIVCPTRFSGLHTTLPWCIKPNMENMETVRIYRLDNLSPSLSRRLYDAQQEAARVWNLCKDMHQEVRRQGTRWPNRDDLQKATKGQFALYSQTVQMICHAFLANVETTRQIKKQNPKMCYQYKEERVLPAPHL